MTVEYGVVEAVLLAAAVRAQYMISSGLAALGYHYINIDEGWLAGRYPNGTIYDDRSKFPSG